MRNRGASPSEDRARSVSGGVETTAYMRKEGEERYAWKALIGVLVVFTAFIFFTRGTYYNSFLVGKEGLADVKSTSTASILDENVLEKMDQLKLATWNMAAINNNPFEYWVDAESEEYDELMSKVQLIIDSPGELDVTVEEIFPQLWFQHLQYHLDKYGVEYASELTKIWDEDFKKRKIVSEFLKDSTLGLKRLISMPDRVTNTVSQDTDINKSIIRIMNNLNRKLAPRSLNFQNKDKVIYRPTVINCYGKVFASLDDFWSQWIDFMFRTSVKGNTIPVLTLSKIPRSKYPALSEEEERISIPLQTLSLAIFDTILVHVLNSVFEDVTIWQTVRTNICKKLNLGKNQRSLQILQNSYMDRDIIFLQEVSEDFLGHVYRSYQNTHSLADKYKKNLLQSFYFLTPEWKNLSKSNQNSVIMLNRNTFFNKDGHKGVKFKHLFDFEIITNLVKLESAQENMVASGDLLVAKSDKNKLLLASFHGDTNGLATIPVLKALMKFYKDQSLEEYSFLFGLDANTYHTFVQGKTQSYKEFVNKFQEYGLESCWMADKNNYVSATNFTTYNGRTYLQPQLNKAADKTEIVSKGDVNPKDFILFSYVPQNNLDITFSVHSTRKDNTGSKEYHEESIFPTIRFPSDHAILSTELYVKKK